MVQIRSAAGRAHGRHHARPFARGFTLIELLVVISIIALLIGLLLPTLTRARDASRLSACLSNVRQNGTAMQSYSNDFNGWFPFASWTGDRETGQATYGGLAGFYNLYNATYTGGRYANGDTRPLLAGYVEDGRSLICPADRIDNLDSAYRGGPRQPTPVVRVQGDPENLENQPGVSWNNISYLYIAGLRADEASPLAVFADETNHSDRAVEAFDNDGQGAGYLDDDNHGAAGGNVYHNDGSGRFVVNDDILRIYEVMGDLRSTVGSSQADATDDIYTVD